MHPRLLKNYPVTLLCLNCRRGSDFNYAEALIITSTRTANQTNNKTNLALPQNVSFFVILEGEVAISIEKDNKQWKLITRT